MGFSTLAYTEANTTFTWIMNWDGSAHSPNLASQGTFWEAAIGLATAPASNGGTRLLGVELAAKHKDGPHPEDQDPGNDVTFRMDLLDILSDVGTTGRGTKNVDHPVSTGNAHQDSYTLTTSRLAGQNGVTITLAGTHSQPVQVRPGGTSVVPTPPPPLGGATQPTPPRTGTPKDFTVIDSNTEGNVYIWASGALRFGEIDVDSVKDMVDKILARLGENECIGDLTIIGHGSPGYINVGNGQTGKTRGKSISIVNTAGWRDELLRLRCKFCPNSKVYLRGCNVGAGSRGARLLFMLNQIFQCAGSVQAPTGYATAVVTTGKDQTSKRGDTAPPAPLANPDKAKTKTSKSVGTMFSGALKDNKLVTWEPLSINSGLIVAGELDAQLSTELFQTDKAVPLSSNMLSLCRAYLSGSVLEDAGQWGIAVDGLIQFEITSEEGEAYKAPPLAILGGGQYLAPDWRDISLVFVLPEELADALAALMENV